MKPRVTWMIAVKNGMPYLAETLASIAAQTYQQSRIMVWDNGSTDGTVDLLKQWIPSRIQGTIVEGDPLPLGQSRAQMVRDCGTEFGALIDADDICSADRLQRQIDFMDRHPEISVLGTQIWRVSADGEDLGPYSDYPLSHEEIVREMLLSNPIAQPSVVFRNAIVMDCGNYRDFSPTHVEDYDLWLRMASKGFKLANLPDRLVGYRVHSESTTQKSVAANRLDAEVIRRLCEIAPALYGCSPDSMLRLRHKNHWFPAIVLLKIARSLDGTTMSWGSVRFQRIARALVRRRNFFSRAIIAIKGRLQTPTF